MENPSLSIIVPCYNEAENIPLLFSAFNSVFPNDITLELILVNNGSTDNSKSIFEQELSKWNDIRFKVVNVEINKGYGNGILSGLSSAKGDILAWTHADLQTDPKDVITAYYEYCKYNDTGIFIKGKRKQRALIPWFFTFGMGCIASMALSTTLTDIGAQPKLFSRKFYEQYLKEGAPYDFSLDLYTQYWAKRTGKIIEIPVTFKKRLWGEAKGGGNLKTRIKVTKRVFKFIFELRASLNNHSKI